MLSNLKGFGTQVAKNVSLLELVHDLVLLRNRLDLVKVSRSQRDSKTEIWRSFRAAADQN